MNSRERMLGTIMRERLTEPVRAHVVQIDLRARGVTDLGAFTSRGLKPIPLDAIGLVVDEYRSVVRWITLENYA